MLVAILYFATRVSRTALFWAAFVLTRPLGAVVGDFLDKPVARRAELSRYTGSLVLLVAIVLCIALFPQRPATAALTCGNSGSPWPCCCCGRRRRRPVRR